MTLRPIPDPGVLKEADAFKRAAEILCECLESMLSVPAVVNAAFALELYLKSLNMEWQVADPDTLGNRKAWLASRAPLKIGHAPSKLYAALDQSMQSDLAQKYQHAHSQSLEETLNTYDGLFQDWRYIFEGRGKSVDLSGLLTLLTFFSEVLNALPQRWV